MKLATLSPALLLVTLCALGCHSSSSTSPNGFNIVITATVQNTAGAATILDLQLFVDGAFAQDVTESTAANTATLVASGQVAGGPHSMSLVIVSQTASPSNYTAMTPDIQVFDANGNFVRDMKLPTQSANLATGQAISYTFSIGPSDHLVTV